MEVKIMYSKVLHLTQDKPGVVVIFSILFMLFGIVLIKDDKGYRGIFDFIYKIISHAIASLFVSFIGTLVIFFIGSLLCTLLIPYKFEMVNKYDVNTIDSKYISLFIPKKEPIYIFSYIDNEGIARYEHGKNKDIEIVYIDNNAEPYVEKLQAKYIWSIVDNTVDVLNVGIDGYRYRLHIPKVD